MASSIKYYNFLIICLIYLFVGESSVFAQRKPLAKQVSFTHDNDVFRIKHITDKYYSFGLILNYSTAIKDNHFIKKASQKVGFNDSNKVIFDNMLYLKGYTPEYDTNTSEATFRPFAGVLNWESSVYLSNEKRLWRFGTVIGVRGKISGAEWIQDNFHDLISDEKFDGWRYQLPNKFLYGINATFVKPWSLLEWFDVFSESHMSVGNYQFFIQEDLGLRIGRINNIKNSSMFYNHLDINKRNRNEYYFLAKFFGRTIFTDTTLSKDGKQDFLNPLDKRNFQAGYHVAFHIQFWRIGAEISHTRNSTESNVSGKHSYGSLAIRYSFSGI